MFIDILLLTIIVVESVVGAPHHDGSESQTHSPNIGPDSESIIVSDGDRFGETHHSDVWLSKTKQSNHTEQIAPEPPAIDSAEVHHGDTYMMGNKKTSEPQPTESAMHIEKLITTAAPQTTAKARGKNENSGAHPVAPVHHASPHKNGGEGITKSIVAHSPVASYVENSKSEKTEKQLPSSGNNSGSVVAHGPMIKNGDSHERKHGHDHRSNKDGTVHSTVLHAPMATEHHPPKASAHHPSLSKNVPLSSGHAPLLNHPVVEENTKTKEPHKDVETTTAEVVDVHSVAHAPTATDPHPPKLIHAHHPSLSKTDDVPGSSVHAPLAFPVDSKDTEIHVEKRSEPAAAPSEIVTPKVIEIHHPLLSKTEGVIGSKSNHEDVRRDEQKGDSSDVTPTTEINGNSLETQHINSGNHPASSHRATTSPSS